MQPIETYKKIEGLFEHLVRSLNFSVMMEFIRRLEPLAFTRNFKGYRPQTLGRKKVIQALANEVYQRNNGTIAEILTLLWNQEHRDLYHDMLAHVKTIDEDVEKIEKIEDDKANEFIDDLLQRYKREDILICVYLNDVKFSENVIKARLMNGTEASDDGSPDNLDKDETKLENC